MKHLSIRHNTALATALAVTAACSPLLWRRHRLTWGATRGEAMRSMPGDQLLPCAPLVSTRAITIDAPPKAIWPWLVQMGPGRGGAYSYDWIQNLFGLNMHSANEILPELQDLAVGDVQQLGKHGPRLRVEILDPGHAFVLRSDDDAWVWQFELLPLDDGTRLVSRNRITAPHPSLRSKAFSVYAMEPASLIMERKMLLGIKQRAEALNRDALAAPVLFE
jgi:hypothetical protein